MGTTVRLLIRTGIVGSWAVIFGFAIVVVVQRLLDLFSKHPETPTHSPLSAGTVPLIGSFTDVLAVLYDGGLLSVVVGALLVIVGWYQILRLP
ncbi:MAG: hypothetical protein ABEJ58_01920 [Halodesulfurarchaeum sp.]